MSFARAVLALAAVLLAPATAGAQTLIDRCDAAVCKARLTPEQLLGEVQLLIEAKRYDEAAPMLAALQQLPDHKLEIRFLSGMLAARRGDHKQAASYYRTILAEDPSQTRVRLELGREMLAMGHVQSADKQFKIAQQAKDLPQDVAATIRVVRDVIRSKRTWRLDFDIGIAPDTNINNATAADTITILGNGVTPTPFKLDSQAKAQSGIGGTAMVSAGARLPVSKHVSALVDVDLAGTKYAESQFDDYQGQIAAGAEIRTSKDTSISIEAVGAQRWFGGKPASQQAGAKAGFQARLGDASQIGLQLDARHTNAMFDQSYDGWQIGAYATFEHSVGKALIVSLGGFGRWDSLNAAAYSNAEFGMIAGFGGELPHGITFGVSGSASRATFSAPMPLFSIDPRKDWRTSARLTVGDRKVNLMGFSPQVSVSYSKTDSSIVYYSNDRLRFRFTFARYF